MDKNDEIQDDSTMIEVNYILKMNKNDKILDDSTLIEDY